MTVKSRASYSPIPEAFVAAAAMAGTTIADEITAYRVRLRAENKSPPTVSLWAGAARQLQAYLVSHGMPTDVAAIRREHLEEWLAGLLAAGAKPSTVNNRYRSVQPLFKGLVEEGLINDSPMRNMRPPTIPDEERVGPCSVAAATDSERINDRLASRSVSFVIPHVVQTTRDFRPGGAGHPGLPQPRR